MSITVVIPNWNTEALLRRAVGSCRTQETSEALELLVVDNGSVDGSVAFLEAEDVPHLALARNVGFARAVNLAVRRTQGWAVLVQNSDAELAPGCLEGLVRTLRVHPRAGGVQPKILQSGPGANADGGVVYSAGQGIGPHGNAHEIGQGSPDGPRFDTPQEVFGVCGAICLLRRDMLAEVGGYDERFFFFYEDVDLNARARLAGWEFWYEPGATARHVGGASWRQTSVPSRFRDRMVAFDYPALAVKCLPARAAPHVLARIARLLLLALRDRTTGGVLRGLARLARHLPQLVADRRRLRGAGDAARLDAWYDRIDA